MLIIGAQALEIQRLIAFQQLGYLLYQLRIIFVYSMISNSQLSQLHELSKVKRAPGTQLSTGQQSLIITVAQVYALIGRQVGRYQVCANVGLSVVSFFDAMDEVCQEDGVKGRRRIEADASLPLHVRLKKENRNTQKCVRKQTLTTFELSFLKTYQATKVVFCKWPSRP